jgi:hypothetical protein
MKKQLLLFLPVVLAVLYGCVSRSPAVSPTADVAMPESRYTSRFDERRDEIAHGYMVTGEAKTWNEAQAMAAAELNRQWAAERASDAEAKRQAPIQEAIRKVKLGDDDNL